MARIRDEGHVAVADKPIRLPVYGPHALDPHQVGTGAIYYSNDKRDGVPRGRLAVSNGATEDLIATTNDLDAIEGKIRRVESIAISAANAPRAEAVATTVPSHEVEALHRRLGPLEGAIAQLRGDVGTLQGGLLRLELTPSAAPSASVPVGPSETVANSPRNDANSPDFLAALLPIERRLSEIEAALELEVLAELVVQAMGGDATAKALIAEEAGILNMKPEEHMAGVAATRRKRHAAMMAARRERLTKG